MIKVKKDWWKKFFNNIYLLTDSRSVCDHRLTAREVDLLEEKLKINKTDYILDLCGGQGRHSIELAKRGYKNITVLDYSDYLINLGKKEAKAKQLKINFYKADARNTGLESNKYSVVIIMANSFGYFSNNKDNFKILKETNRLLVKKGKLLLDLTNSNYVRKNLKSTSWHRINADITVCRQREIQKHIVKTREIAISKNKGLLRDGCYCERLYTKAKIAELLKKARFKNINTGACLSLHKEGKDYGLLTSRMIVTTVKS